MKTFYGVVSKFFDSGRVTASIITVAAEKKPESTNQETRLCDIYYDYFDTFKEAEKHRKECYNA